MRFLYYIAFVIAILGGLNLEMIGLLNVDFIANIFGEMSNLSRVIYILGGLALMYLAFYSHQHINPRIHGSIRVDSTPSRR